MTLQGQQRLTPEQARGRDPSRTVVVGYDGSEEARRAFLTALGQAEPHDTLVVVHAYAPIPAWLGAPYFQRALDEVLTAGRRVLDDVRPLADRAEAEVLFELHEGAAADVIARIAESRDADEIVVGSRGLGRVRAALASVSQQLVRSAGRPVLVVPPAAIARA
jgi:nucleotide-binding universal stress UspA family protein